MADTMPTIKVDVSNEQSDLFVYNCLKVEKQSGDFAIEQSLSALSGNQVLKANIVVIVAVVYLS